MNEAQRQYYLQALGIEGYEARFTLPGAAPSPVLAPTQARSEEAAVEAAPEPAAVSAKSAPALADPAAVLRAPVPESRRRRSQERPAVEPGRTGASRHRSLLRAWRLSSDILVLDSYRKGAALPVEGLLRNIARALGRTGELPPPRLLDWQPELTLPPGSDLATSVRERRGQVRSFIAAACQDQPCAALFLMGSDAILHALPGEILESAGVEDANPRAAQLGQLLGQKVWLSPQAEVAAADAPGAMQALVLPSLAMLLEQPRRKAQVWTGIRQLRREQ